MSLSHIQWVPKSYEESTSEWPLLLFLHGAGERGDNLTLLRKYGPPRIVLSDPEFPFILVAPQCPIGTYWRSASLLRLLDETVGSLRVDKTRIYVTGVSMGGYGTWQLAMDAPQRFAAIAPICGGGNPQYAARLAQTPIWAFHGDQDDIVPLSETVEMVDAVQLAGGNPRLTVFPGVGHDSWTPAYAMPELFQWMLAHRCAAS